MLRTFNCGIGMIAVVAPKDADTVMQAFTRRRGKSLRRSARSSRPAGEARVVYDGKLDLGDDMSRKRVAVLISGRGSNMAALIEAAKDKNYPAEIALVVSNRAGCRRPRGRTRPKASPPRSSTTRSSAKTAPLSSARCRRAG